MDTHLWVGPNCQEKGKPLSALIVFLHLILSLFLSPSSFCSSFPFLKPGLQTGIFWLQMQHVSRLVEPKWRTPLQFPKKRVLCAPKYSANHVTVHDHPSACSMSPLLFFFFMTRQFLQLLLHDSVLVSLISYSSNLPLSQFSQFLCDISSLILTWVLSLYLLSFLFSCCFPVLAPLFPFTTVFTPSHSLSLSLPCGEKGEVAHYSGVYLSCDASASA